MYRSKKRLAFIMTLILIMFSGLVFYYVYFQLSKASNLKLHPANGRNWVDESKFARGIFLDRTGYELTERSQNEDGLYNRKMRHKNMYSHIIGYNSEIYGRSALEYAENAELLNITDNPIAQLRGQVLSRGQGNNIRLCIDNDIQYTAYTALEGHKGAAIVMDPNTGDILAMVSQPSFNVENLEEDWSSLVEDPDNRLFPRSYRGLYTPGSVMKPITALALLEGAVDLSYQDKGETEVDGYKYTNYKGQVFEDIGLEEALKYSSNVYFVDKTKDLDPNILLKASSDFGLGQDFNFELNASHSRIPYKEGMEKNAKAAASFGQGDLLISPLEMATAYSAIANGGKLMRPRLVDGILYPNGDIKERKEVQVRNRINPSYIQKIQAGLEQAAEYNGLNNRLGERAACKTGTAQIANDSTNAWTIAYSPAKNPKYLVCIVLEDDGRSGGEAALPIAAQIINEIK